MKKLIFTTLLAVLGFSATAFAQDNNEDRISTFDYSARINKIAFAKYANCTKMSTFLMRKY